MLAMNQQLNVRLDKVRLKKDSEGGRWATLVLAMKVDGESILNGPLSNASRLMAEDTELDSITTEQKLANVRVTFQAGTGRGPRQAFDPKELSGFTLNRETATQAGAIKKDRGTGVELEFGFTVPLNEAGTWAIANFGDDLVMTLDQLQGELPLEAEGGALAEPTEAGPDSQEVRNERIIEAEAGDATAATGPPVKQPKKKRGRKAKK